MKSYTNSTNQKSCKGNNFLNYNSPIKRYSFSSEGRGCSTYGLTVKREYHFLSDLERDYFDIIDFKDSTINIQENYPLLPLKSTLLISEVLNIPHPHAQGGYKVMTSDFYILYQKNNQLHEAVRQIKPSQKLNNSRVLEKFAIEENWWNLNGITDWKVMTEKEIDSDLAKRIRHLKSYIDLERKETFKTLSRDRINKLTEELKEEILGSDKSIAEIIKIFDNRNNLPGSGVRIFKHLACLKEVPFNLSRDDYGIFEGRASLC